MSDYLTEQEQVELLKKWIKQYAFVVVLGVAIAFALISGWRYFQGVQEKKMESASVLYDEMLTLSAQNNPGESNSRATQLYDNYPKTAYGEMSAFFLARHAVGQQNYIEAEKYLSWVSSEAREPQIRQIAKIRLSRVQLEENKPQAAIETLTKVEDDAFLPLVHEIRGDAWLKLKNIDKSRESYQEAIKTLPNAEMVRPLLLIKLDNLSNLSS